MVEGQGKRRRELQEQSAERRAASYKPGCSKYLAKFQRRRELTHKIEPPPSVLLEQL